MKKTLAALSLALALLTGSAAAFSDVDGGLYYAAPIAWAVEQGITTGTSEDTFSPDALCTQGQILTFLWRAAGSPQVEEESLPAEETITAATALTRLLEELSHNVFALRLIRHNLKWPRADELQEDGELHPLFAKVYGVVRSCPEMAGCDELELYRWLTAIVSMCVSVCYGCMVEQRPDSLEEMKPVLFRIITHSLGSEGGSCDGSAADSIRGSVPE